MISFTQKVHIRWLFHAHWLVKWVPRIFHVVWVFINCISKHVIHAFWLTNGVLWMVLKWLIIEQRQINQAHIRLKKGWSYMYNTRLYKSVYGYWRVSIRLNKDLTYHQLLLHVSWSGLPMTAYQKVSVISVRSSATKNVQWAYHNGYSWLLLSTSNLWRSIVVKNWFFWHQHML